MSGALAARDRLLEAQDFRHAQARRVDEFDETGHARRIQPLAQRAFGGVEPLARGREQAFDLRHAQELGKRARPARAFDGERRIVAPPPFGIEKLVKLTDRGQAARQRRGARATARRAPRDTPRRWREPAFSASAPSAREIGFIVGEIAPIGLDRIEARAALGGERLEEAGDERGCPRLHFRPPIPPRTGSAAVPRAAARASPRWRKACDVSSLPRGVRCTKPSWMR